VKVENRSGGDLGAHIEQRGGTESTGLDVRPRAALAARDLARVVTSLPQLRPHDEDRLGQQDQQAPPLPLRITWNVVSRPIPHRWAPLSYAILGQRKSCFSSATLGIMDQKMG